MVSKVIWTKRYVLQYTSAQVAGVLGWKCTFGLIALLALYNSTAIIWTRYAALLSTVSKPSRTSLAPRLSVRFVCTKDDRITYLQEQIRGVRFQVRVA